MRKRKIEVSDTSEFEAKEPIYIPYVKQELLNWRKNFECKYCAKLDYCEIAKKIKSDFDITISSEKIRAVFENEASPKAELMELVALAKLFDIPLLNISEYNYNKHVRQKLNTWRKNFEDANHGATLNYSAIAEKLIEDFGIKTSPQKISAMFDVKNEAAADRVLQLQEVAALAQLFNIPLLDLCEYPDAAISDMDLPNLVKLTKNQRSSIKHLKNDFYSGDYYCYYFRPKHYQDRLKPVAESEIEEAILNISIEDSHTTLTLKELKTSTTFYGKQMPSFTLTGPLYHFENPDIAYSFIKDPTGRRAMALMFTYLNLSADIRYYMTVGMMTFSSNQTHNPLFQKMAVFRDPQDYRDTEVAETLRGILALNTGPIIIDEDTLEELREHDEILEKLVSPAKALKKCYVFSETGIWSNAFFISDENEKMQKILQLRKNSLLPTHEIVSEPDYFADFIKKYQLKNRKVIEK
ncbi:hypothetical protein ACTM9K_13595 [Bariatricus sp. HCP3S3_E12]|uniref:hypothetical protein n=1 Tax=Bariatricus sp. HCP3S3_E12 TaxID=3438906 RepID=UPI003F8CC631